MKTFIPLENNPDVMTHLAHALGLSPALSFRDLYSLTSLSDQPRPAYALLVTIPMTESWAASRAAEDVNLPEYNSSGPSEPVLWFKQTIEHACGLIGLLHGVLNLPPSASSSFVLPETTLEQIKRDAIPLKTEARAQILYDSEALEKAHAEAAVKGDTLPPAAPEDADRLGNHFVTFVRGSDGHLWELEGGRKGPLDRGALEEGEDMLSEKALELGLGRLIKLENEHGQGVLRFSAIVLGPSEG